MAQQKAIRLQDLKPYVEIAHADPFVPSLPLSTVRKNELLDDVDKHVFVFERGAKWICFARPKGVYVGLTHSLRDCWICTAWCAALSGERETYQDVLIYKKEYAFTDLDRQFIETLKRVKEQTWHTHQKHNWHKNFKTRYRRGGAV